MEAQPGGDRVVPRRAGLMELGARAAPEARCVVGQRQGGIADGLAAIDQDSRHVVFVVLLLLVVADDDQGVEPGIGDRGGQPVEPLAAPRHALGDDIGLDLLIDVRRRLGEQRLVASGLAGARQQPPVEPVALGVIGIVLHRRIQRGAVRGPNCEDDFGHAPIPDRQPTLRLLWGRAFGLSRQVWVMRVRVMRVWVMRVWVMWGELNPCRTAGAPRFPRRLCGSRLHRPVPRRRRQTSRAR